MRRFQYMLPLLFACKPTGNPSEKGRQAPERNRERQASSVTISALDTAIKNCGVTDTSFFSGDGFGSLRIGQTASNIHAKCDVVRDTVEPSEEGEPARSLTVRTTRGMLSVSIDSDRVRRVTAFSRNIRTRDSLGLESTLSQLFIDGIHGLEGEGALYLLLPNHCGVSFRLTYDIPEKAHRNEWSSANVRRIPDTTRVDQVFATGCSTAD